jgi:hypothetical protein
LETIEGPVVGEPGKVFSTGPEVSYGEDGKVYYIKGCNSPIVFTEVVGCRLAATVGLKVPNAHIGFFGGDLFAAVESVPAANRNIRPWLRDQTRIDNWEHLFEVIAVDTWLVNDDRNMGNVVGSSVGDGRIEVFMIDFEKSRTLAESPFMGSGAIDPRRLWPTEELGTILRQHRLRCPDAILGRIAAVSTEQLHEVIMPVAEELPFIHWQESGVEVSLGVRKTLIG